MRNEPRTVRPQSAIYNQPNPPVPHSTNRLPSASSSRRRPQSAAVMRHHWKLQSHSSSTQQKQRVSQFYLRVSSFISKVNENQHVLPDGLFNNPTHNPFEQANKFRPASSRKAQRLRKVVAQTREAVAGEQEFFRTAPNQGKLFQSTYSTAGIEQKPYKIFGYCKPVKRGKNSARQLMQTFQSLSMTKYDQALRQGLSLSVQGRKCF